ncbi:hypothetical protein [uncultured Clostridium sp.]|uniref:hypothetical protein n=1 Tax=uncultured Clostridium sp. TaxID=59620 RepID=UPI0026393C6E|nr:hypothetical protein [uncultured Clostridium sp.]
MMFEKLFSITISVKDFLLVWYLIYSLLVIFCKPVRKALINWLQGLDKDKYYSIKSDFKLDKEYNTNLEKDLQDKIIEEIRKEKE